MPGDTNSWCYCLTDYYFTWKIESLKNYLSTTTLRFARTRFRSSCPATHRSGEKIMELRCCNRQDAFKVAGYLSTGTTKRLRKLQCRNYILVCEVFDRFFWSRCRARRALPMTKPAHHTHALRHSPPRSCLAAPPALPKRPTPTPENRRMTQRGQTSPRGERRAPAARTGGR